MSKEPYRAWRYHAEYEPTIFEGEAIAIAEEAGWVDSPAKIEPQGNEDANANTNQDGNMDGGDANSSLENEGGDSVSPKELSDEEVALGFEIPENLVDLSVKKLKKLCKHRGFTGYSNMREGELIALLEG